LRQKPTTHAGRPSAGVDSGSTGGATKQSGGTVLPMPIDRWED
jgi:hypothetical protein